MARADWSRTDFVLSSYNHRWVIIAMTRTQSMFRRVFFLNEKQNIFKKFAIFVSFSRIISAILLKQLVTSGSVNVAIVTSTSSRWLFADIHVAFGD